jgi:hypothetical protein
LFELVSTHGIFLATANRMILHQEWMASPSAIPDQRLTGISRSKPENLFLRRVQVLFQFLKDFG